MILNIRGGLGTQVLELSIGLMKARKKNENVDEIVINAGGMVVPTVKYDYISELFSVPCPVLLSSGTLKQGVWTKENFNLLSSFDHTLLEDYGFKLKNEYKKEYKQSGCLHVRGKDRQVCSISDYQIVLMYLAQTYKTLPIKLITDDIELVSKIEPHVYNKNISFNEKDLSPKRDWFEALNCDVLVGPFSSFSISAMLFDPAKKFHPMGISSSNGPIVLDTIYYDCINLLLKNKFKNGSWL